MLNQTATVVTLVQGDITALLPEPGSLVSQLIVIFNPFLAPLFAKTPEVREALMGGPGKKSVLETDPLPFQVGLLAAGLTLAGLDPGMALRAFAELLNALIPL